MIVILVLARLTFFLYFEEFKEQNSLTALINFKETKLKLNF